MKPIRAIFLLAAFAFAGVELGRAAPVVIENESLVASWEQTEGLSMTARASGRAFISRARLSGERPTVSTTAHTHATFGRGEALEFDYPNGNRDIVMLFAKLPFALIRSMLRNSTDAPAITRDFRAFSALCEPPGPEATLTTLGTGGLLAPDKNPGSYVWLAVAEPQSRNGTVFGWLTHDRGSGVVFSQSEGNAVRVEARIDYGKLRLASGKSEDLETLAVGYFDDARLGLEQWADAVAKVYDIKLREQPSGYCTWYSKPHGGAADEKSIATLSEFAAKELKPFGFSVVQIDDKWQAGWKRSSPSSPKKDFRSHDPSGPYPHGMKAAADQIKSLGLVPGIWFMPFAGTVGDPFFDQHLDWFTKTADGKPYDTPWGGTCLDMSHPEARAHLRDVASRICREWGYEYIKIDGLWTGTATKQLYVNSGYKEDDIGAAVFHDPDKTNLEIFRDGLKLVREAAGKDVFILGCNAPQNMRSYGGAFGLVDAMRVGPDNGAEWNRLTRGTIFGSRHYFLHRRVWLNDPDPVYVRASMPEKHAQLICSWVALSGQLNLSSEWLPGLPSERLDILKRTMPPHHATARPVDYFENDPPRIWTVTDESERGVHAASSLATEATSKRSAVRAPTRSVVGLFNWKSAEQQFDVSLEQLGLDKQAEHVGYDYWKNEFIPSVRGRLKLSMPGESCAVLAIRPRTDHPQVISTSRHVTQGLVELSDEKWNQRHKTLSGRTKLVGNDPCELRIALGDSSIARVEVPDGIQSSHQSHSSLARVQLASPVSREVSWTIHFK